MFHFILGRARSGKTSTITYMIQESLKSGEDRTRILLVPEQYTLVAERDLMEALDQRGLMRVEVLSFQRLAHRILPQEEELDDRGRIMILRHILQKKSMSLKVYRGMKGKEGFIKNLNTLLVELMRGQITPKELKALGRGSSSFGTLEDISILYQEYLEYTTEGIKDREARFELLAERILKTFYLKGASIWMDGFSGFTGQEYSIIEALLSVVSNLTIALTLDEGELFEPTRKTYERLEELAEGLEIKKTHLRGVHIPTPWIRHIEEYLYSYPLTPYEEEVPSSIYKASTPTEEVEVVASQILSLVRERGYRFNEIVVVTKALDEYGPLIRRIFPLYDIPFFLDEKRSIQNSPIILSILSSLKVVIDGFMYQDLFTFLKTGFSPLLQEEWEKLENYVLEWGIEGEDYFQDFTSFKEGEDGRELNSIRRRLLEVLGPFYWKCRERATASSYTELLEEFLERLKIERRIKEWIHELKERGLDLYVETYIDEVSQTFQALEEVLFQIKHLLGEEEMDLREYSRILESGLSQSKLGVIPPTLDQVLIGDLERTQSRTNRALFVLGVNEGILPAPNIMKGLLLDQVRMSLQERGLHLVDGLTLSQEERFNIYTLLSKTEEYLLLTCALNDREGHSLQPSLLMKRIDQLFPKMEKREERREERREPISSPLVTFHHLIQHLQRFRERGHLSNLWREVFCWYYHHPEWRERLLLLLEQLFSLSKPIYLPREQRERLFTAPYRFSLSQFTRFLGCPFSFFVHVILKPEERREYRVRPSDLGSLIHKALEIFTREILSKGLDWKDLDLPEAEERIVSILETITSEYRDGLFYHRASNTYYGKVLESLGKRTVALLKEQSLLGEYRVSHAELIFGENGALPPLEVPLSRGEVLELIGRIDRLDTWERGERCLFRIIDYKTGRGRFSLAEALYGQEIQLPLYVLAVMRGGDSLFQREMIPGGLFYYRVHDPLLEVERAGEDVRGRLLKELRLRGLLVGERDSLSGHDSSLKASETSLVVPLSLKKDGRPTKNSSLLKREDLNLFLKHFLESLRVMGEELLGGRIAVEPLRVNRDHKSIPCHYCDYGSICGFDPHLGHRYRDMEKKKDEEIIEELRSGRRCP